MLNSSLESNYTEARLVAYLTKMACRYHSRKGGTRRPGLNRGAQFQLQRLSLARSLVERIALFSTPESSCDGNGLRLDGPSFQFRSTESAS